MANEPARNPLAPLTPDEELAWRALARAVLVIPKVLDGELLQAQGLGLTEYSVLMNLSEQPGRSMRMSELANAVMISASGLTRVVERLTRQGLAERVKAGTDGRGQLAILTPAGLARLEHAYPTLLAAVREHVMDHLADLDLAAFTQAMAGIGTPETGPPVRRTPNLASLTNGRQRETTPGRKAPGEPEYLVTIEPSAPLRRPVS